MLYCRSGASPVRLGYVTVAAVIRIRAVTITRIFVIQTSTPYLILLKQPFFALEQLDDCEWLGVNGGSDRMADTALSCM